MSFIHEAHKKLEVAEGLLETAGEDRRQSVVCVVAHGRYSHDIAANWGPGSYFRPLFAEERIQFQLGPFGCCGGSSGTWAA